MSSARRRKLLGPQESSSSTEKSIPDSSGLHGRTIPDVEPHSTQWKKIFGFTLEDFRSYRRYSTLCCTPADPSNLAVFRIAFGLLMVFDTIHERGLSHIVQKWSDEAEACYFPLFDFMVRPPLQWIVLLYLVMGFGAIGIAIGLFYRLSCLMFVLPYWYLFFLEKTNWNNHSYLFGLTSTMFFFIDANRYWSVDAWLNKDIQNARIPVWNYGILRYQIMLVYFVAGLKKLDRDWVEGYSMSSLSIQWVFDPFRSFLTNSQIDKYIVHWGGLILDLSAGFLLYFDNTRHIGALMSSSFHVMNSRMFRIGQFPYVMLCTTAIFYPYDWPKKLFPSRILSKEPEKSSSHCLSKDHNTPRLYHKFFSAFVAVYALWQAVMPYSHFITKGYNNWSGGLYGYSWDMMVHNWNTQHIKIKYVSRATGEEGFLDPEAFVSSRRWAAHPDMMHQHARCIAKILEEEYHVRDVAIYMDIWQSMNHRFNQRIVDPNVDLVSAEWSPFKTTSYLLPLLNSLADWRTKLEKLSQEAQKGDVRWLLDQVAVTFIADFPGMMLENFISADMGRTNITLLAGSASLLNPGSTSNITLKINEPVRVNVGMHEVFVTSETPACYMYTYSNTTKYELEQQLSDLENKIAQNIIDPVSIYKQAEHNETLKRLLLMRDEKMDKQNEYLNSVNKTWDAAILSKVEETYLLIKDSFWMSYTAVESMITGESMIDLMEKRFADQTG